MPEYENAFLPLILAGEGARQGSLSRNCDGVLKTASKLWFPIFEKLLYIHYSSSENFVDCILTICIHLPKSS